jgi:hypothetical protein
MNLLRNYFNFKKLFKFGMHTGLTLQENKDINFRSLGTYYNTFVLNFIFFQWFLIKLKTIIKLILAESGNFFILNDCFVELTFLQELMVQNPILSVEGTDEIGVISDKSSIMRVLFKKSSHLVQVDSPSFVILISDFLDEDRVSLIRQATRKRIPVLSFTTQNLFLNGVYTIPSKSPSFEFLVY